MEHEVSYCALYNAQVNKDHDSYKYLVLEVINKMPKIYRVKPQIL